MTGTVVRWVNDEICYLTSPNPTLEAQLDAAMDRIPGKLQWRVRKHGALAMVGSFIGSVTSGFATPEVLEARKTSCSTCPMMVKDANGSYCNGCRCGRWKLSDLNGAWLPKLGWAKLNCPMRREGFSNASKA